MTDSLRPRNSRLFDSFWMAGFECSSQRRSGGVRLDLLRATKHDRFALKDYQACARLGLTTIRDGLRWHRIESAPGHYDWSSWLPMVEAAERAGVEVVWDIFHYGIPDFHDIAAGGFPTAFANYARAAAEVHLAATGRPIKACLLNEISFVTWAVEVGYFPLSIGKRPVGWLKRELVKAAVLAAEAMDSASPGRRLMVTEPLIHVAPQDARPRQVAGAKAQSEGQFEVFDLMLGRLEPELGGHSGMVDAIGLNYYPHNQWLWKGSTIPLGHHEYRPLSDLLIGVWKRYQLPLFIAETGAELSARAAWIHYVCSEVRTALAAGVPVEGICLFPVTDYPGWDNGRKCPVGLFGEADAQGDRPIYEPLLEELVRQSRLFDAG